MEGEEILFHRDALFGEYRANLVDVQWITLGNKRDAPPVEAQQVVEEFEPQRPVPDPVVARSEVELEEQLRRQSSMTYTLFQYLAEGYTQSLMPSLEDLVSMLMDRCKPLVEPVQRQATQIRGIWHTFVQRMLVEMLAEDQYGGKIREARQMLEEPYLLDAAQAVVRGAHSNFANVEHVRALTQATAVESLAFDTDEFFKTCVGPMKRGRRRGNEKPVVLNQLQVVKKHFTTKSSQAKAGGGDRVSAPDSYPLFVKVLSVVAQCIPEEHNHGWYLTVLHQAVRQLTSAVWPARGLVASLLNAERVLPRKRLTLTEADLSAGQPLYCAYTAKRLEVGDEVWLLRVVLNSGARYKKWHKKGRMPAVPCSDPFFTNSVRAYFIRCHVVSQCSVFYSELPQSIVTPAPVVERLVRDSGLPLNRRFCINTLWLLLNQQRQFITTNGMARHVFHRQSRPPGLCLAVEQARLTRLLHDINPLAFRQQFRTFLALATFGEAYVRALLQPASGQPPANFTAYCDTLWDTVLDFVDMHFVCTGVSGAETREIISFAQFNLDVFGVELSEGELSRKKFVQQHGKLWVPRLRDESGDLVAQLLWHSSKRIAERGGALNMLFSEKQLRLWRVQRFLQQHPFLFMTLFECLFQPQEQKIPLFSRFPDAMTLFSRLNLCISTV